MLTALVLCLCAVGADTKPAPHDLALQKQVDAIIERAKKDGTLKKIDDSLRRNDGAIIRWPDARVKVEVVRISDTDTRIMVDRWYYPSPKTDGRFVLFKFDVIQQGDKRKVVRRVLGITKDGPLKKDAKGRLAVHVGSDMLRWSGTLQTDPRAPKVAITTSIWGIPVDGSAARLIQSVHTPMPKAKAPGVAPRAKCIVAFGG